MVSMYVYRIHFDLLLRIFQSIWIQSQKLYYPQNHIKGHTRILTTARQHQFVLILLLHCVILPDGAH